MEQTTEPDEFMQKTPQEISEDDQKTPKDTTNSSEIGIQKTPENIQLTPLQEEPINTRGEKYNLRPKLTQTTLTHTDTRKRLAEEIFFSSLSL